MLLAQGVPLGPEFRINTYTTNRQQRPSVASDSAGNFVVTWESRTQDGSGTGVFAQRYTSTGAPLGPEFRVNSYTTSYQLFSSVASDSAGNFVVTWESTDPNGFTTGIFAQRYASTGTPLGGEFGVNAYTTGKHNAPSVASDSAGNFVIAWEAYFDLQDPSGYGVFAQRYASTGVPLGGAFRVNTITLGSQRFPSVASDLAGNFVVTWETSGSAIFAQRYASTGVPLGGEFQVSTPTPAYQRRPSVASDSAGNFIVAWHFNLQGGFTDIFAQRYSSTGTPLGAEFQVNSYTTGGQALPKVASDSVGNFVVTWQDYGQAFAVFAQRYSSAGVPLGGEFQVNTYATGFQGYPSVSSDSAGSFVVVWESYDQDGSGPGIFGQRYSAIVPVELQSFRVE